MLRFNITLNGETYKNIRVVYYRYLTNHNLAIQLYAENGEPLARITTNVNLEVASDEAVIDTNNCPWAIEFIEENKLGNLLIDLFIVDSVIIQFIKWIYLK